ncbi:CoB--CoM heterodisulfide reductase iron-sulfur subunit A family protein [bacterium]|nr:CoB--CoM heterodisulfide reductase iron-sulfur subunit A family protein [bacterium]
MVEFDMEEKNVLVIGAGIAGVTTALKIADRGIAVHLVEKDSSVGGHAQESCCKAVDNVCTKCGACLLKDRMDKVEIHPNIKIYLGSNISDISKSEDKFSVRIKHNDKTNSVEVDAVVVATGFTPFDARGKGRFGYGRIPYVFTGLDIEEHFKKNGEFNEIPKRAAFIQCVGSRDPHLNKGYCSRVCCRYALRLAMMVREAFPEVKVDIFHMDIQSSGKEFNMLYDQCKNDSKIEFIKSIPTRAREISETKSVRVLYEDMAEAKLIERDYDLLVLSIGIMPSEDNQRVENLLGINMDEFGFFEPVDSFSTRTNVQGVFLSGTCEGPKSISEAIRHADKTAVDVMEYL